MSMVTFFIVWFCFGAIVTTIYAYTSPTIDDDIDSEEKGGWYLASFSLPPVGIWRLLQQASYHMADRNRLMHRRDGAMLDQLYQRYVAVCRANDVNPLPRTGEWGDHWDLVLRLQSAENKKANLHV